LCPGPKSGSALSARVAGSPGFVLESGILEKERKQQGSVIGTNKKPQQMIETDKLYIFTSNKLLCSLFVPTHLWLCNVLFLCC